MDTASLLKSSSILSAVCVLTACGGGGGTTTTSPASFIGAQASYNASASAPSSADFQKVATLNNGPQLVVARPTVGNAEYQGVVQISVFDITAPKIENIADFGGDLLLLADFTSGALSGGAKNFASYNTGATGSTPVKIEDMNGTLTISSGIINGTDLVGSFNGTLAVPSTSKSYAINAALTGSFSHQNNTTHLATGRVIGTATSAATGGGNDIDTVDGKFVATTDF